MIKENGGVCLLGREREWERERIGIDVGYRGELYRWLG